MDIHWPDLKARSDVEEKLCQLIANHPKPLRQYGFKISISAGEPLYPAVDKGFFHCDGAFVSYSINGFETAIYEVIKKDEVFDYEYGRCCQIVAVKVESETRPKTALTIQAQFAEVGRLNGARFPAL